MNNYEILNKTEENCWFFHSERMTWNVFVRKVKCGTLPRRSRSELNVVLLIFKEIRCSDMMRFQSNLSDLVVRVWTHSLCCVSGSGWITFFY